ncbi:hypothetical protein KI387_040471, partial [Taxus chinensis]
MESQVFGNFSVAVPLLAMAAQAVFTTIFLLAGPGREGSDSCQRALMILKQVDSKIMAEADKKSVELNKHEDEDEVQFIMASVLEGDKDEDDHDDNTKLKTMSLQQERKMLPIDALREELIQVINDHQIVVVVGETGSGKTTQIPQYLYEAGYTKLGKIGCTQPHGVATMSVASRVAQEMGVKLGHDVGYSVEFEDCTYHKTVLTYMTDAVCLREFMEEPDLASYSCNVCTEILTLSPNLMKEKVVYHHGRCLPEPGAWCNQYVSCPSFKSWG